MKPDKVLSVTGMAARSGHIVSGEFSTENTIKKMRAHLVIVASDASDNTKKHFSDMCAYRKVPYAEYADKTSLGHAIGKEFRASLAVTDENLAKLILNKLEETEQLNHGGNR